jgi:lysozyme
MTIQARVVDLFHGDVLYSDVHKTPIVNDFNNMASTGIWGLIHKATQGIGASDQTYAPRIKAARQAGLLTGAYHFNTGDTAQGQVNHFFDVAQPDDQTLMCLDFEDNNISPMPLSLAAQFLQLADEKLGRTVWLYGGNRPKELLSSASDEIRQLFGMRSWWLCQYANTPSVVDYNHKPLPWDNYTIWQFTGDGVGPLPHSLPGVITQGIDLNTFSGTKQQFALVWPGKALATIPTV